MISACSWPVERSCLPVVGDDDEPGQARLKAATDTAVLVLWALTGRQFGVCASTIRPCPHLKEQHWDHTTLPVPGIGWMPVLDGGVWRNMATCSRGSCGLNSKSVVELPGLVQSIHEVVVDGEVIDEASYQLEGNRLYRAGGRDWPAQDLSRPAGDPGTWSVTYNQGTPPPSGAGAMVGQLAKDFWDACGDPKKCRIPRRVTTITRNNMTFQRIDPTDIFKNGQTGLPDVDLWIRALNPHQLSSPSNVASPEIGVL